VKKIFVANWKANKTVDEALAWLGEAKSGLESSNTQVVICPGFTALKSLSEQLQGSEIKLGAQDVSPYPSGAYTGEVSAEILKGLVTHCIVGHSERKKYFAETESAVAEKVKQLLGFEITPILCVANLDQLNNYMNSYSYIKTQGEKIIFVYEPPSAISGGGDYHPESPDEASKIVEQFKSGIGRNCPVLYGGSVNPEVIDSFLKKENIDGFLVGKASLTPSDFLALVSCA